MTEESLPICARPSIKRAEVESGADWWLEQDNPERGSSNGYKTAPTHRQNLLRGQLHCYECPFLVECRRASWGEPAHIWGGLTYPERYEARLKGKFVFYVPKVVNTNESLSMRSILRKRFMEGESLKEISTSTNRSQQAIWGQLRKALTQARLATEGRLWYEAPPPILNPGMTLTKYRLGAASSSGWATNNPPTRGSSSSGQET